MNNQQIKDKINKEIEIFNKRQLLTALHLMQNLR